MLGVTVLIKTAVQGALVHAALRALQSGTQLYIRVTRQVSDPFTFLRPCSGSSDTLCLLFLPPPTPTLESLYFPLSAFFQFSDFRWRREKMACDLAGFNRRANKRADKETPARFYDLSLGMGFPSYQMFAHIIKW